MGLESRKTYEEKGRQYTMETTDLFSGKADAYRKARPGYPKALFPFLREQVIFPEGGSIADVGSGTGIFSKQLLQNGYRVYGVEPNEDMREKAEMLLSSCPGFFSVKGTAENTLLPNTSVDGVTAAQAFHWFSPDAFRRECLRILKPGGNVLLLWNHRVEQAPLVRENAEICRRHCPSFTGFSGGNRGSSHVVSLFFGKNLHSSIFQNDLTFTWEGFLNRNLSSSYAPKEGEETFLPFVEDLKKLFDRYASGGTLCMPNVTAIYWGNLE